MARNPLNAWAKERRPEFERRLAAYSLQGLQNVIDIANNAFDPRIRLQANIFLLEKILGKDYSINREQPIDSNITINVLPIETNTKIGIEDAELIQRVEAGEEIITLPDESLDPWDVEEGGEDWENKRYDP